MLLISQNTIHIAKADKACCRYTEILGFARLQDENYTDDTRWLTVWSSNQRDLTLALDQMPIFSSYTGIGRSPVPGVETDDCPSSSEIPQTLTGGHLIDPPMSEPWGFTARFVGLYGNEFQKYQSQNGGP